MEDDFTVDEDMITLSRSALSWLGVFVKDYDAPHRGFPNRFWLGFGYTLEDMAEGRWQQLIHPDDREQMDRLVRETHKDARHTGNERFRIRDRNGEWHWILTKGIVESFDENGQPRRYVGVDHDVTDTAKLEDELRAAQKSAEEQALEADALRTAGAVITSSLSRSDAAEQVASHLKSIVDIDRVFVFEASERSLVALDASITIPRESADGEPKGAPSVRDASDRDAAFFLTPFGTESLYEVQRRRAPDIIREPTRSDSFWLLIPLVSRNNVLGVVAAGRKNGVQFEGHEIRFAMAISDYMSLALVNARLYEEMERLATTDQLSNLLTRRAFFDRSDALMRDEGGGAEASVLVLDIDYFKRINDDFGHIVGDEAIRRVAAVFRDNLRDVDIVGRYGGEEFCALLPRTGGAEGVAVAERICKVVRELSVDGIDRPITVSIGVATTSEDKRRDLSELLNAADTALYAAKRGGRDQVRTAE
jgi:diguanylate cyclase (GGDEF)-like protein/PAS domain S-box-containing protein